MKAKFEVIEQPAKEGIGWIVKILRDGEQLTWVYRRDLREARDAAIKGLLMPDYLDFEEWYARRQYPAWRLVAVGAALCIMVLLLVAWEVLR